MPDSHAYLSASSSSRWLHCSVSRRLEAPFPNKSSIFAEEGTAAHAMAEQKLLRYLKRQNSRSPTKYDTPEMDEMTDIYRDFVAEAVEEIRKTCEYPLVLVEDRLDFSKWVPESFGTGDAVIVSPQKLWVIDLKYGKGVWVRAGPDEKSGMPNTQLSLYALGAYSMYSPIFEDIKAVSLSIVQPRLGNIDTYTFPIEQLLTWADEYVKPRALMAFKGEGEAVPGEWCKFCRAKPVCRALAEQAMNFKKKHTPVRELKSSKDMENWCDGKISVALIHPASAGHGLNIQSGGHILIWFGVTWSLELYQQTNARLNRQGQTSTVVIHHIITKNTIDEDVMRALSMKAKVQDALIESVKARLSINEVRERGSRENLPQNGGKNEQKRILTASLSS